MRAHGIRQHDFVGNHVVDPGRAGGAGIGQPIDLHWRGSQGKRLADVAATPHAQVDKHIHLRESDGIGHAAW